MSLYLVLTYYWFHEVAAGRKRVEYRERSDWWQKQIWEKRDKIKTVRFSRGYTQTILTVDVSKIDTGPCPYPGWPGTYYRMHFKKQHPTEPARSGKGNNNGQRYSCMYQ